MLSIGLIKVIPFNRDEKIVIKIYKVNKFEITVKCTPLPALDIRDSISNKITANSDNIVKLPGIPDLINNPAKKVIKKIKKNRNRTNITRTLKNYLYN